jgi:hypothetical protein
MAGDRVGDSEEMTHDGLAWRLGEEHAGDLHEFIAF